MQELIRVGDEIIREDQQRVDIVDLVEEGKYGLRLVKHSKADGLELRIFLPWELPPIGGKSLPNWYGWKERGTTVLSSGLRLGWVCFAYSGLHSPSIEEYDKEWERTIETMRLEESQ